MKIKRITSLCLTWSFIILMFTSLVLYVLPSGKIAHWANWSFLGLGKEDWAALHTNNGYLFLIACLFHIFFNFSHIVNYLKNRKREVTGMNINSLVALGLVLALAVFTIAELPPVRWIQDLNEHFKGQAEEKFGNPPYGHAELSSVSDFARRTGLNADEIVSKLTAAGFQGVSVDARLADIAELNGVSPQTLVNVLPSGKGSGRGNGRGGDHSAVESNSHETSHAEGAEEGCASSLAAEIDVLMSEEAHVSGAGGESGNGTGYGQKTLRAVCEELGLDEDDVLKALKVQGFKGKATDSLKTIAETKGERPSGLVHLLKEMAGA